MTSRNTFIRPFFLVSSLLPSSHRKNQMRVNLSVLCGSSPEVQLIKATKHFRHRWRAILVSLSSAASNRHIVYRWLGTGFTRYLVTGGFLLETDGNLIAKWKQNFSVTPITTINPARQLESTFETVSFFVCRVVHKLEWWSKRRSKAVGWSHDEIVSRHLHNTSLDAIIYRIAIRSCITVGWWIIPRCKWQVIHADAKSSFRCEPDWLSSVPPFATYSEM